MDKDDDVVAQAFQRFDFVTDIQREDLQLREFRYHLLRLTVCGLRHEEVPVLLELGRLVFLDLPSADEAQRIADDPAASVLARVIAQTVVRVDAGKGPARSSLLGAVLGAYLAVGHADQPAGAAVDGAIAGASSAWAASLVDEMHGSGSWTEYVRPQNA